jgi:hypothetical protein
MQIILNPKEKVALFNISLFVAIFLAICIVFLPYGSRTDGDSGSYNYLITNTWAREIPNPQRPFIFPLYLLGVHTVSSFFHYNFYVLANCILAALSIFLISRIMFRFTSSITTQIIVSFICLFSYDVQKYVNFKNPEVLLTLGVVSIAALSLHPKAFTSRTRILLLIGVMTVLTFIKPIFLYFPLVLFTYSYVLLRHKKITLPHFRFMTLCICVIYLIPVLLWSIQNKQKVGYPTFSIIQTVNLAGVLKEYKMLRFGPQNIGVIPMRYIMTYPASDIWITLRYMDLEGPDYGKIQQKYALLNQYVFNILMHHPIEYVVKSLPKLPEILYDRQNSIETCLTNSQIYSLRAFKNPCDYVPMKIYRLINSMLNDLERSTPVVFILFLSAYVTLTISLYKWTRKIHMNHAPIFLLLLVSYILITSALSTYWQYARIRSPIDYLIIVLLCSSLYGNLHRVRIFLKNP